MNDDSFSPKKNNSSRPASDHFDASSSEKNSETLTKEQQLTQENSIPEPQESEQDQGTEPDGSSREDFRGRWLRAVAENENLRRRLEKEKEEQIQYAVFKLAKELTTVAENLERALKNMPEKHQQQEPFNQFYEGVSLTYQEMSKIFQSFGITKLEDLVGQKFDPHKHQVMFEKEYDSHAPGTITEVLQGGYMLHDRLLKPALVGVSKKLS